MTAPGRFDYRAVRSDGSVLVGQVGAASQEDARRRLVSAGLFPVEVTHPFLPGGTARRISSADLAIGLRLLGSLCGAGMTVERALGVFPSVAPASWGRDRLDLLRGSVREGVDLGNALVTAGIVLPDHIRGMIEAGERAGTLTEVLREAARLTEEGASTRAAIRGALAYPALLGIVGSLAIAMLVGIVLPRFADLLHDAGQRLPMTTRLLLAGGSLARTWWPLLIGLPVLAVSGLAVRMATDRQLRQRWHGLLLRLPVAGGIRHALAGSRVASVLGALLRTGIPLPRALSLCEAVAGDDVISARMAAARLDVVRGERLSVALAANAVGRPIVAQLVRAGESSGEVHEMLGAAAKIESEWCLARIRLLTRLIEPLLILAFGGAIAVVAAGLLQAVYSIRPTP